MHIRDFMETNVITVSKNTTYKELAQILYQNNISGAPVVEGEKVVGVISEKDLFRVLYPFYKSFAATPAGYTDMEGREEKAQEIKDDTIEKFMSTKVVSVTPDDPIMKAGALMLAYNYNRLPVMENGKLVGIITAKTIFRAVMQKNFGF